MNTQRRLWFLIGPVVVVSILLGLGLYGFLRVRLQPVYGQAPVQSITLSPIGMSEGSNAVVLYPSDTVTLPKPLDVSKSYMPAKLYAGDPVTFVVTVSNPNTTTFGITVTDQLVPLLTIVCGSEHVNPEGVAPVCDAQQNAITYIAPITAQTNLTLTFRAVISSTMLLDQDITNTVWVDDGERIISRTVTLDIITLSYAYLPFVMRRWPPVPYPPTNFGVTAPDMQGNYTISWDYVGYPDVTMPTSYELQESFDAAFSNPAMYFTTQESYSFTDKPSDLYYYRVRGKNSYGNGEWAYLPVVQVNRIFFDGFSDATSGWRTGNAERYNFWDPEHPGWEVVANLNYVDGHYQIYVPRHRYSEPPGQVDTFWVWPAVAAPLPPEAYPLPDRYCVEARASFVNAPVWVARWGIVFGANADFNELYAFNISDNANRAVINYHHYLFPGNNSFRHCVYLNECDTNLKIFLLPWYSDGYINPAIHRGPAYNTLKVVVRGSWVDSYSNGILLDSRSISFPREHIGLIGGSWEVTPVDLRIDYFRYNPDCPEAQQ
ncbi:MAG: hypothetical protein JXR84_25535 [Anaerolineae bacterium]|nr:hypothetical protein [Anaerolineae bacterium]